MGGNFSGLPNNNAKGYTLWKSAEKCDRHAGPKAGVVPSPLLSLHNFSAEKERRGLGTTPVFGPACISHFSALFHRV